MACHEPANLELDKEFFSRKAVFNELDLQKYQERADRNYETIEKRMLRDNVSPDIREQIIYVQSQTSDNTEWLFSSLSFMQIFIQFSILMVFYSFYFTNRSTTESEQSADKF